MPFRGKNPSRSRSICNSGISIWNNKFLSDNKNGISLKSTSNVLIQGNTFSKGTPQENVRQNNCADVTVK